MRNWLAIIGAVLALFSTLPYIIDIVKGRTKPNIVSWFTWTLLTAIAMAAAFTAHEPKTGLLMAASTVCVAAVVILGLKYGIAKFSFFDIMCQLGALLGLLFWLVFNSPTIGIVVPVIIDFIAALPTWKHSWQEPAEETWQTFLIGVFAPIFTIASLTRFNTASLLYPLYLTLANAIIVSIVLGRRKQLGISFSGHSTHETLHENI